jgi:hypothetical protein
MRDELAGRLLDQLLSWNDAEQALWMSDLQKLAAFKYDGYEGFAAGERFFESLARWISQFEEVSDRHALVDFVRSQMLFISRDEMNHAIDCVYPDFVKQILIQRAATECELPPYLSKTIVGTTTFKTLRRKTLFLGLSDGARLDRLRRASPELSHEQFSLMASVSQTVRESMARNLEDAIGKMNLDDPPKFKQVVFIDDFYGSGTSLIGQQGNSWEGKLVRGRDEIEKLKAGEPAIVETDAQVAVVIYVASAQAEKHIRDSLDSFAPDWQLRIIQSIPFESAVRDADLIRLSNWFYDDVLTDVHKGRSPLGFMNAALPLVLHHNTPNNSIAPLWADSSDRDAGEHRHALFPRYERHHVDRP